MAATYPSSTEIGRERYLQDKDAARAVLAEWLRQIGDEVPWENMATGDIVIMVLPDALNAMVCIDRGKLLGMDPTHGALVVGADIIDRKHVTVEVRRG